MQLPERSRLGLRVLLDEALAGITQRPGRSALTALGTVIGVAVLVVVLGLTTSASIQVTSQFDLVEATEVKVTVDSSVEGDGARMPLPLDAERRANRINGIEASGLTWKLSEVSATNPPSTLVVEPLAVSPGIFAAAGVVFSQGRGFDYGHDARAARVAVIGSGAATDLGITDLSRSPAILIDGLRFTVIGIIGDTARMAGLLSGVAIPTGTAHKVWHDPTPEDDPTLVVDVQPGAAEVVGAQLPLALSPAAPQRFVVALPPDPQGLRAAVSGQLSGLFLGLGAVCLVVGMIGIANTTIVAVIERTGEIGLRRAMGARPRHIAWQFLFEAAILGLLGGLIGTSLGVCVIVAVCALLAWTAVVSPLLVFLGPIVGLLAGVVAGIYPSLRASRLEPVAALRA